MDYGFCNPTLLEVLQGFNVKKPKYSTRSHIINTVGMTLILKSRTFAEVVV